MGSTLRVNDTLQITREQGFPGELDIAIHLLTPFGLEAFKDRQFSFQDKEGIRNFQQPPVLNFLVENREGKHIYWGLIRILAVSHDYLKNATAGSYQLAKLYTPEQMRLAPQLIGLASNLDFFGDC
ncbi:MAG: hypothetical protein KC422_25395 [Trueperaceae bacterium]|nr:hypothetical protein [Trueperaceae bacterium]